MPKDIKLTKVTRERLEEMQQWCLEKFGRPALWRSQLNIPDSPCKYFTSHSFNNTISQEEGRATFSFVDDSDATMFSLRWSS